MPSGALGRLWAAGERFRGGSSIAVRPADARVDPAGADGALRLLGPDGEIARDLDASADREAAGFAALSPLTTQLAEDYLDRIARPIPALTPAAGVQVVSRGYAGRIAVEHEPVRFGAPEELPGLASLPARRDGRPPQDLLTRVVKATRRGFPAVRAVPVGVWDGFALLLTARVHLIQPAGDEAPGLLAGEVVDGLARFGWVLRLVDDRYGLEPERTAG